MGADVTVFPPRRREFWEAGLATQHVAAAMLDRQIKRPRPEKFRPWLYGTNGAAGHPLDKWFRQKSRRGIDAKTASRDGGRTIVFSRSWLNAFVFGVRLAWLSPFPLGVIDDLDLTTSLSVVRLGL
jgi:hypothetical protein